MKAVLGALVALLSLAVGLPVLNTDSGNGTIWAVLVAGSNGFYNYRHQADVCHAYQIFRRHGVPDSQIITMMYDDIAHNNENPEKGTIYNNLNNGPNVYKNILKDYTKKAVTTHNFISVLTGNKTAIKHPKKGISSGKVLESGPNDHVFINFVDHGGTGVIGFPEGYLYADDLIATIQQMHDNNMFKRLVFYMEACESGSMFESLLPSDIEVFAMTAANPDESSYACYCDSDSGICYGDEFSVAWMEDIDAEDTAGNLTSETFRQQYKKVVKNVEDSHPKVYGETSMEKEDVTDFFGSESTTASSDGRKSKNKKQMQGTVSSREVVLHILNQKIEKACGHELQKLQRERDTLIEGRKTIDQLFHRIVKTVTSMKGLKFKDIEGPRPTLTLEMMPCYKTLVDSFHKSCVNINKNTYALDHLYKLANLCLSQNFSTEDLLQVYAKECTVGHRALKNIN